MRCLDRQVSLHIYARNVSGKQGGNYMKQEEKKVNNCRVCGGGLTDILSLGNQYVSDFVVDQKDTIQVPLDLARCEYPECGTIQLRHNAPPASMWNDHYGYKSGINRLIRENLQSIVIGAEEAVGNNLKSDSYVIDIGANDGTLLDNYFAPPKSNRVGFEPSANVAAEARAKGHIIIPDFFNAEAYQKITDKKADVITAISMFYDLDKPNEFLQDIKSTLSDDGVFIIQQNYLKSMLEQNAFDNICHEHRCYYSLKSLDFLLRKNDLEIFDVDFHDTNGGSIRTYIKHKNSERKISENVSTAMQADIDAGLDTAKPYEEFAERILRLREDSINFLKEQKELGNMVIGCGASTRGNTTLQYFGITEDLLPAIGDSNREKWGKRTPGSNIPIVSPHVIAELKPDYQYVLIWHLFEGLKETGKFAVPMPEFRVVEK